MKHSLNIPTVAFYSCILMLVFLVLSCENKEQDGGSVPGSDSTYAASLKGEMKESYNDRLAEQRFMHYCAPCHGTEGRGDGFNAVNLEKKPPDFTDSVYMKLLTHEYLVQAIIVGGKAINKSPLMPAWGHTLSPDDIQRLAVFVRGTSQVPGPVRSGQGR